jgi:BRCA1 C Terminus (BRCT) domain
LSGTNPESTHIVNTVANRRSKKAMEAMLHGIPLVSPEWITACLHNNNVPVIPAASMYIRSLPSKSFVGDCGDASTLGTDYGIAFTSAALDVSKSKYKPLGLSSLAFVYTAGFSAVKQGEISELLRDSGVKEIITKSTDAINHIKKRSDFGKDVKFVFLCNDTNVTTITSDLEELTKEFSKKNKKGTVWIVNSYWLYDSITCGVALFTESSWNNESYKPVGGKGLEFWNIIRKVQGTAL